MEGHAQSFEKREHADRANCQNEPKLLTIKSRKNIFDIHRFQLLHATTQH